MSQNRPQKITTSHTHTQLFYDPFSRTTQVSWCQKKTSSGLYGARGDITGRHTNNPAQRHSIWTNKQPTSPIPQFYARCPSCCNPANLSGHGTGTKYCWLANPVAWLETNYFTKNNTEHCKVFNRFEANMTYQRETSD